MRKNIKQKKINCFYESGYAILLAVMIISIISIIVLGLSNSTYKQLVITSVAKDSQIAFYQSDIATECGLYLENQTNTLSDPPATSFNCGVDSKGNSIVVNLTKDPNYDIFYGRFPTGSSKILPCFEIDINKTNLNLININSRGYSFCDKDNFKTVERGIQTSY